MTDGIVKVWDDIDLSTLDGRVAAALDAATWGSIDGAHHKQWVIDQMVRMLTGCPEVERVNTSAVGGPMPYIDLGESDEYLAWVRMAGREDERELDGSPTYEPWDTGISP